MQSARIYDLSAARAVALSAQGLIDPYSRPASKKDITQLVRRLGGVQIDTLQVVQRSQNLVLWSRLGEYDPVDFEELIYHPEDRLLFEGWKHAASIIPIEDYRYQMPHMRHVEENPAAMSRRWLAEPGSKELLQHVRQRITKEGALRAADFEYRGPKRGSWWDWKPAKNALEHLFAWGELMISNRINFQRVYDLRQRVLPDWVDEDEPTAEERDRYWLRQGIRAMGICQPAQAADYSYRKRNVSKKMITEMIDDGSLVTVNVRVADGSVKQYVVDRADQQLLVKAADGGISPQRTTFLSPFDNLFWARGRDGQFWDFRNVLEAYKPATQRKWGYFNMPILHHDSLVGRIDPKIDRKNRRLILKAIYLEDGIEIEEQLLGEVTETLKSFMQFHQALDLEILNSQPAEFGAGISARM
jgi:uncharacterized protein YcaQ